MGSTRGECVVGNTTQLKSWPGSSAWRRSTHSSVGTLRSSEPYIQRTGIEIVRRDGAGSNPDGPAARTSASIAAREPLGAVSDSPASAPQ